MSNTMSPYLNLTSKFAFPTYASLVGTNVGTQARKSVQGKAIVLAHDDQGEIIVGGFSNFARMYEANGLIATGKPMSDDEEAKEKISNWQRRFPQCLDLATDLGLTSFTNVVLSLVKFGLFSVDSVLDNARNRPKMKLLLEKNGLMSERKLQPVHAEVIPATIQKRAFEPKCPNIEQGTSSSITPGLSQSQDSGTKNDGMVSKSAVIKEVKSMAKSLAVSIDLTKSDQESELDERGVLDYSTPKESNETKKKSEMKGPVKNLRLSSCFDSEDEENRSEEMNARKRLRFKDEVESEALDLTFSRDEVSSWKGKYEKELQLNKDMQEELAVKTADLRNAESTILSMKETYEENMEIALSENKDLQNVIDSAKVNGGEKIEVSKALFEDLISKVSQIGKIVKDLPDRQNLKLAVDYVEAAMEEKLIIVKEELEDSQRKSLEEALKKSEDETE